MVLVFAGGHLVSLLLLLFRTLDRSSGSLFRVVTVFHFRLLDSLALLLIVQLLL